MASALPDVVVGSAVVVVVGVSAVGSGSSDGGGPEVGATGGPPS